MRAIERLLWSIALPGFGQFLNGKFVKGLTFVFLEFLVNVQANFNEIIILSFHGNIQAAIRQTNYQWLMFYPCLYFFAMWDAYRDAGGGKKAYSYVPFVMMAYFVTVGLIYSSSLQIFGILFGPVWLPMIFVIPGLIVGLSIQKVVSQI
ncbi:hypothetical protein [Bacillus sp. EB600]|uniref:hypothetical protein n=1 Tax=Bacillus sp. EB600 TaxID=2806345 RepID=UPI00210C17E2|nr:hypothetical protein [Bacillus sp. EB600]MCQ6281977.1 hypothetical protein [Bacillus sp. EB600]